MAMWLNPYCRCNQERYHFGRVVGSARNNTWFQSVAPHVRGRCPRSLGEVLPAYAFPGFVRIHRGHAVNPRRVREIVRQDENNKDKTTTRTEKTENENKREQERHTLCRWGLGKLGCLRAGTGRGGSPRPPPRQTVLIATRAQPSRRKVPGLLGHVGACWQRGKTSPS